MNPTHPTRRTPPNHPSNILLPLHHALSLQLTWHCNAACRFCALRSSPNVPNTMKIELFDKILDEVATARGRVQHIEITGGEVFTQLDLLQTVAEHFRARQFPWIPISNAFWATSREKARQVLTRLPGMLQIVFSVDRHHQEFVPESHVVNAAQAALDLGIRVFLTCGYFEGQTPGLHLLSPALREIAALTDRVDHHFFPALALGRALDLYMDEIPCSYAEGPCYIMSRLEITPDGDYDACCVAATAIEGGLTALRLGNAWNHTEQEMSQAFLRTPLCLALATIGPAELYRRLTRQTPSPPPEFRSLCHACIRLCTLPDVRDRVANLLDRDRLWPLVGRKMQQFYNTPTSVLPVPKGADRPAWRHPLRTLRRRFHAIRSTNPNLDT